MAKKGDKIRFHELLPPGQLSYIVAAWWTMWWSMGVITSVWLCSTASSINLGGFLWQRDTLRLAKPSSAIQRQLVIYRIHIQRIIHQSFRFSWEGVFFKSCLTWTQGCVCVHLKCTVSMCAVKAYFGPYPGLIIKSCIPFYKDQFNMMMINCVSLCTWWRKLVFLQILKQWHGVGSWLPVRCALLKKVDNLRRFSLCLTSFLLGCL